MNIQRFSSVLEKIDLHPDKFLQIYWHSYCGTKHCFGGWAQILSGRPPDQETARNDARRFLELTYAEAEYVLSSVRTLAELRAIPLHGIPISNQSGLFRSRFGSDGFDSYGFDSGGFNRDGLDRDGLDRNFLTDGII